MPHTPKQQEDPVIIIIIHVYMYVYIYIYILVILLLLAVVVVVVVVVVIVFMLLLLLLLLLLYEDPVQKTYDSIAKVVRGNHLCNTTCRTQVFFKSGEARGKLW